MSDQGQVYVVRNIKDRFEVPQGGNLAVEFTIANSSSQNMATGIRLRIDGDGVEEKWCSIEGPTEFELGPNKTATYRLGVAIPADALIGAADVTLTAYSLDEPEQVYTIGPWVKVVVTAAKAPPKPFNWKPIAIAAGIVVGLAILTFAVTKIFSNGSAELVADFELDPEVGVAPLVVAFTDTSQGAPTRRIWDFGDGETLTTTDTEVRHEYGSPGAFTVRLVVDRGEPDVESEGGEPSETEAPAEGPTVSESTEPAASSEELPRNVRVFSSVEVIEPASAGFTIVGDLRADQKLTFRNASSEGEYEWDFGDGSAKSTEREPTHTYAKAGDYEVKLAVAGKPAGNAAETTAKIAIDKAGVAAFKAVGTMLGIGPLSVQFKDLSQNAQTWRWDFGDNQSADAREPSHTYASPGSYTVVLTITTANGETHRTEQQNLIRVLKTQTKTESWQSGWLMPGRVGGDNEFDGHGPTMTATAKIYASSDGTKVLADITMHAKETKSNWSEAKGTWTRTVMSAPTGYRVQEILLPKQNQTFSTSITSSSHSTITRDVSGWGKFELRGDRRGSDIGSWTAVNAVATVRVQFVEVLVIKNLKMSSSVRTLEASGKLLPAAARSRRPGN